MIKKTSEENIKLMQYNFNQGLSVAEISRKLKIPYPTVYSYTRLIERGFPYRTAYQKYLVIEIRGFRSYYRYKDLSARKRQQQPKNKKLSNLIKTRLMVLNRNQSWFAEQLDISRQLASLYAQGKIIPHKNRLEKIFSLLELPHQTLDEILE